MKHSAKIDYACKAILELGCHWPNQTPVQIQAIAQRQKIPLKFLTQILINLKQMGIVESLRGKSGGYLLSKEPNEIKLVDVMRALNGLEPAPRRQRINANDTHVMDQVWQEIDERVCHTLEKINFEMICHRHSHRVNVVTYEI